MKNSVVAAARKLVGGDEEEQHNLIEPASHRESLSRRYEYMSWKHIICLKCMLYGDERENRHLKEKKL